MPLPKDNDFAGEIKRLRAAVPSNFAVGYSGDWGCAEALLAGADCWYSVVAGLLPKPSLALARAAIAGDTAEVARLDRLFQPLWTLFKAHGSLRVVYAAAEMLELMTAQPPRPVLPLGRDLWPAIEAAISGLDG
jgi:4-hydroxy-tetrahydrodipicolinate synthase